jgi:hypothetical protein
MAAKKKKKTVKKKSTKKAPKRKAAKRKPAKRKGKAAAAPMGGFTAVPDESETEMHSDHDELEEDLGEEDFSETDGGI